MSTVRQLLQGKGSHVWSVSPGTTVYDALELMADKSIGAVLVVDEKGRMVGIFSERDYARKVALKGLSSRKVTVGELMTTKIYAVDPDVSVDECMRIMTARKIGHLPVLENGELVGVISVGDVVRNIIKEREFTIEQLERYIVGPSYPGDAE